MIYLRPERRGRDLFDKSRGNHILQNFDTSEKVNVKTWEKVTLILYKEKGRYGKSHTLGQHLHNITDPGQRSQCLHMKAKRKSSHTQPVLCGNASSNG